MPQTSYERLQTLAQQDYERRVKELNISDLDEILYQSMDYMQMDISEKQKFIARKVYRPVVKSFVKEPDKWLAYLQRTCGEEFGIEVEINTFLRDTMIQIVGERNAVGDLLTVHFQVTEDIRSTVYGFANNPKSELDAIGVSNPEINVVDLAHFFAGLYLFQQLREELRHLAALSDEDREKDAHYQSVQNDYNGWQKRKNLVLSTDVQEMLTYCEKTVKDACELKNNKRQKKKLPFNKYRLIKHVLNSMELVRFSHDLFYLISGGKWPELQYADVINYSIEQKRGWQVAQWPQALAFLELLMYAIAEDRGLVLANYNRYKQMDSEYAKSFMTKKNRSEKLQDQTKESKLWKYFGYVEYDEDVDIGAIGKYESEFERFYNEHLAGLDLSENAIRFRKLGQHHAAGLYYPHVKCLCVDIHSPHSLVHELGHLIDYQMGNLSAEPEFSTLYRETKMYLQELLEEDDELSEQLRGKTKYNMQYYLTPTEVFARCFELYAYYVWGERSNLLRENYGGVYNISESHLSSIREYFDKILK